MKIYLIPLIAAAGLLAGCDRSIESASQDFNTLPQAVQKAVRAEAPQAEIASVSRDTRDGMEVYVVEFRHEGQNSKMTLTTDGKVLSSDMAAKPAGAIEKALTPTGAVGTKFSALPAAAQKTILTHAPEAQIADISRQENDGRVYYEVSFQEEGKNPSIRVAEDGTLVQTLQK